MTKIAENTWAVGEFTVKKVVAAVTGRATWYVIDAEGGMAGFDTRKAALHCCERRMEAE
jgi:hypothetical protein